MATRRLADFVVVADDELPFGGVALKRNDDADYIHASSDDEPLLKYH
jgi:hypothetical protein